MEKTTKQYKEIIQKCKSLFGHKLQDYGTAWRIMRVSSVTDQIYIKANRIRSLQQTGVQKVDEDQESEFIGIINYSVIALIQLQKGFSTQADMSVNEALSLYTEMVDAAFDLMQNKNHDYGEAWRDMRVSSITDLILQKILRVKQIENNQGKTIVSEGLDANYLDILNYAVFAMILLSEMPKKNNT